MSQFHFPRINFWGGAIINPATGNNSFHQPLVYYDPIQARALLPPRLYVSEKFLPPGKQIADLLKLLPPQTPVMEDEKGSPYIEIASINNLSKFRTWATSPLGTHELDRDFHDLYELLICDKNKKTLRGILPGYWNYFGDMTFQFDSVQVRQIETFDVKKGKQIFDESSNNAPPVFEQIIGAELKMQDQFGKPWGVMIDVCPTMALYSQVFCDFLILEKEGKKLFRGKPCKASLRFLNFNRIVNQKTIEAASGSFFSTIAMEDLEQADQNQIIDFFKDQITGRTPLKGLFVRYNLLEVVENQNPDYDHLNGASNPARATLVGSITPWLEGDMRSITMGRQLVPQNKILPHCWLGPAVCKINFRKRLVSLDLIASIPEIKLDASYEVYELGTLKLKLEYPDGEKREIGKIAIGKDQYNRNSFLTYAGMVDFSIKDKPKLLAKSFRRGRLILEGQSRNKMNGRGTKTVLLSESPYMIASDQAGVYIEAGDDPSEGYRSYSADKEPCRLRIFKKGYPQTRPVSLQVLAYTITNAGMEIQTPDLFSQSNGKLRDNQPLILPATQASNVIFYFTRSISIGLIQNMQFEIVKTGHFINLRVLPKPSYDRYLDYRHPRYTPSIDFEFLYREIFELYELLFPISSVISPFNEQALRKGAFILRKLMHPDNWASSTYMPSSRELSSTQHALFEKWLDQVSASSQRVRSTPRPDP